MFEALWLYGSLVKTGIFSEPINGVNGKVEPPTNGKTTKPKEVNGTVTPTVTTSTVTSTVTPTVTTSTFTPTTTTTLTDTKTDETVVTTHGVGKVLYRGNGAVIDYGVTPGASTVITVPAEQVAIVQTAIDSGVMSPGDGSQTILTVQAEEKKFTKTQAEKIGVHATTFFNVMNQYGDHSSSLGGSGIRDTRVIGGTNLPFTYVKPKGSSPPPDYKPPKSGMERSGLGYRDSTGRWRYGI